MLTTVTLNWWAFSKMTGAREAFPDVSCVYGTATARRKALRLGVATKGLNSRYRGGNAYSINAAMHGSGNLIIVAAVRREELAELVEHTLTYKHRNGLPYSNQLKGKPPAAKLRIRHRGHVPKF